MSHNVKLLNINNVGTVLAVIQSESQDAITVKNAAQLATDEDGNIVVVDYLESISNPEEDVIFMKYNIISMSTPSKSLSDVYVQAIEQLNAPAAPKVFMPEEKKIIV